MPDPRRPSPQLSWVLLSLGCIATCTTSLAASKPDSLQGQWEVIQVAVDRQDQPHWLYVPADPRLLGRQVRIDGSAISIDDDSRDCLKPRFSALPKSSLQQFIGQAFPRPPHDGVPPHPVLSDFRLTFPDASVRPLRITCDPDNSEWNGAWMIPLSADRLLTNHDNSGYVLVLRRRKPSDPIAPSFACAKTDSAAEQTICGSAALAGYDRSVSAAYRRALKLSGDGVAPLRQGQREWLKSRNACGIDVDCLAKSMRDRVDELMQQ
jgi:uncharacterized protein YecT (DUF1311 family)